MFAQFRRACAASIIFAAAVSTAIVRFAGADETKKPATPTIEVAAPAPTGESAHKSNRLSRETSPYLLMHAQDPVDWYPWGPEALEKAKHDDKPIFLSVGYSSCYWCHVMERLVFMDEDIARYMNEHFVNIKVDREERPDIDDVYMTALHLYFQAIGSPQAGGWPMSMFLTPAGKPFAGGTYFPPKASDGQLDFPSYMRRVDTAWRDERESIVRNADILTSYVRRTMKPGLILTPAKLERSLVTAAADSIIKSRDPEFGGVGFSEASPNAPKFPSPARLALLEYQAAVQHDVKAAEVLDQTLDKMAAGGIRDHIGGGFHRYSTDRQWRVPHFEKMLYDQAQLADVYTGAFLRTKNPLYRQVAQETFDYVLRDMTDARGGFYSALDAETEGIEGKYYVWSPEEVRSLLGDENAALFMRVYGFDEAKTFEQGYVLHRPATAESAAKHAGMSAADLEQKLAPMRRKLLAARNKRQPLFKDDKILTSWNGLMIRALARAGAAFERPDYTAAAEKAARFILADMRDEKGALRRQYRGGQAKLNAYLDDYAFLVDGLLMLHQTTHNDEWLKAARELTDRQIADFWDAEAKGCYFTSNGHEELIARTRNANDSALPAGNSISIQNLTRLASLTGEQKYRKYAQEALSAFAPQLKESQGTMVHLALALALFLDADQPAPKAAVHKHPTVLLASAGETRAPKSTSRRTMLAQLDAEKPADKDAKKKPTQKIKAHGYLSADKLTRGGTCRIVMIVDVEQGWHINTNPAKPDSFIPTEFTLKSKNGTTLTNVQYPAGKMMKVAGLDEPQSIYDKQIKIFGVLNVPENVTAGEEEFELNVRYQACNDKTCLPPKTVRLEGKVPIVKKGEPVNQINQDKFAAKERPKTSAKQ